MRDSGVGTISAKLNALKHLLLLGFAAVTALLTGCDHGLSPKKVLLSDPEIEPLLRAMEQIDRASLGFTPITTNAQIRLEIASGRAYDAMLHVYGATSHTIAFRKTQSGYRWISEQEIHQGPKWYQTVDGTFREDMVIEYQTEQVDGIPTNQLYIRYTGSDTNLAGRELTLPEARSILAQWSTAPVEPWPGYIEGAPDLAPLTFVLFMLVAFLFACFVALVAGAVVLGITAISLTVGIISTALLIGVLRRSVSAAFRALFIQVGAAAGMIGGALATSIFTWTTNASWNSPLRWLAGVMIGCLLGILFAWLFNRVWTRIARELTRKLERRGN